MSSSTEWAAGGGGPASPPDQVPADPAGAAPERQHEAPAPRPDPGARDVPWFLPAGRAGLAPDSVTVDDEAGASAPAGGRPPGQVTDVVGAPPWAGESAGQEPDTPPPWESGPWPGPGPETGDSPATGDSTGRPHSEPVSGPRDVAPGNRLATAALVTGIAGIAVLPGLILGILGLRRARASGAGLARSWAGIALSLLWAAGIVVFAIGGSGSSADPGCSGYQAGGRAAAAKVSAALTPGAPAGQLGADLSRAANTVNGAAASAQDVAVRTALSALTSDLQSAHAEVIAGRHVPAVLATALSRDVAAAARLCGGPSA